MSDTGDKGSAWARAGAGPETVRDFERARREAAATANASTESVEPWDAIILGGGAAGLSLLCHLGKAGWGGRVAVIDDGSQPVEQRAWAWWGASTGLCDDAASTTLRYLVAAGRGWSKRLSLSPYAYRSLAGVALSRAADAVVREHTGYARVRGHVVAVEHTADVVIVSFETRVGRVEQSRALGF